MAYVAICFTPNKKLAVGSHQLAEKEKAFNCKLKTANLRLSQLYQPEPAFSKCRFIMGDR